jgi:hypothetical protein
MWKDAAEVTSLGRTTDLAVPPTSWTARVDGTTTAGYRPSTAVPPVVGTATNRSTTRGVLATTASSVRYGARVAYSTYATYLKATSVKVDYFYWNWRRTLQYSIDRGATWTTLRTTTGADSVLEPWPNDSQYYSSGYTQVLTRNTWFRWAHPGDLLTTRSGSSARLVSVTPIVTAYVARSGAKKRVYGKVTRIGGSVLLSKYSTRTRTWVKVATAPISAKGLYTFAAASWRRARTGSPWPVTPPGTRRTGTSRSERPQPVPAPRPRRGKGTCCSSRARSGSLECRG